MAMNDTALYQQILGVTNPWIVRNVNLSMKSLSIEVLVEYALDSETFCPTCGASCSRYDHQKRSWRHLDTCQLQTIVTSDVPRVECKEHGIHQIEVPWAENNSRLTALFEALVIRCLMEMSVKGVAELLGLSWDQVAGVQERAVIRGMNRREEKPVTALAVDETSFQKHHEYVTVLVDRDENVVLDVLDDRKAETLGEWLENRPETHREAIETITMDMWDPFLLALKTKIPEAERKICFDRYHVAQHFGKAVDKIRAQEHRGFLKEDGDSPLVGTKHEWLKNSGRIDNRSRREFMALTKMKLKTARAWAIKETAASLWDYQYRGIAENRWHHLLGWIWRCRLDPMIKVGRMIKRYLWGILNAIEYSVTNAIAEGVNSRIQWIKAQACGYRNRARFRNAILFHLGGLNLMPGKCGIQA